MKRSAVAVLSLCLAAVVMSTTVRAEQGRTSVLFVGNSFLFAYGSPVKFYRADTVTDLNSEGIGGVPALFKSFADQAGLAYDVFLETRGGIGLDFHLENKLGTLGKRGYDTVVMHGFSTLDREKPRDPTKLIETSRQMADFLRVRNPKVQVYLMSTWARADQVYPANGAWAGKGTATMTRDIRAAYDRAAVAAQATAVIPVGEALHRAIEVGIADGNPYDGVDAGKLNLWTYDNYHASTYGYYLEALVLFGQLTGRDPRSLGENECSGFELGLSNGQVKALQQVAFDQLAAARLVTPSPLVLPTPEPPDRCAPGR